MRRHIVVWSRVGLAALFVVSTMLPVSAVRADDESESQIRRGREIITKIFPKGFALNLAGKNRALVDLGSYLVNTTGCNDCHTAPNWAIGGNPYKREPEQINASGYLAGGRDFGGGVVSPNITPDASGQPAGLTLGQFLNVMHTGGDPDHPDQLLQIMPWPLYRWKTDRDLTAMYEYLRAIPSLSDGPHQGP